MQDEAPVQQPEIVQESGSIVLNQSVNSVGSFHNQEVDGPEGQVIVNQVLVANVMPREHQLALSPRIFIGPVLPPGMIWDR